MTRPGPSGDIVDATERTLRPPARGTRPGNRRALTLEAATTLFYERGYANVAMGDIADAVNVGASAIYRHFSSKSEILVEAIRNGIAPYTRVLAEASDDDIDGALRHLAETAFENRRLGVLWQREGRNLDEPEQRILRDELRVTTRSLARLVQAQRPELTAGDADLIAWSIMSALVSVGFQTLRLPHDEYVALLEDIAQTLAKATVPSLTGEPPRDSIVEENSGSRRDEIITAATHLFAERGFGAVGVDEIAEAVGIAGPSIYSHFASKQEILVAAIQRGSVRLSREADDAAAAGSEPRAQLGYLVDSYLGLASGERYLLRMLLSEMDQLPVEDRDRARKEQRDYIDLWAGLFMQYTDTDVSSARIRVQAVLLMVNDVMQTPHLRALPGIDGTLRQFAGELLNIAP